MPNKLRDFVNGIVIALNNRRAWLVTEYIGIPSERTHGCNANRECEQFNSPHFFAETLWLMRGAQPLFDVEIGGVAVVQSLAGYSGFPEQSRMCNGVTVR